jgi:hypothetical protein
MPTATYVALANVTLSSTDTEVSFASIPNSYRDLVLVCQMNGTNSAGGLSFRLRFNADDGNNYNDVVVGAALGAGAFSNNVVNGGHLRLGYNNINGTSTMVSIAHIMDYAVTDKQKLVLTRETGVDNSNRTGAYIGRWASTSAITTVRVSPDANSLAIGSTFALYGIVS